MLFSTELQKALLTADWPPELLAMEVCKPVYIQPTSSKSVIGATPKDLGMPDPAVSSEVAGRLAGWLRCVP